MKKVLKLIIIFISFSASFLNAQVKPSIGSEKLLKEVSLPPFETVVFKGGGSFYLHYSPTSKVEIKGGGPCVEEMEVVVSSGMLSISPKGSFSKDCKIEFHVFTPSIKEIQQDGGGRIVINEGFAPVDIFKCSIDGGGNIKMAALRVDALLASIEGGGVISAQVSKKLHGKIRGGGLILYHGDPAVESNISGGGAIKRK
jgi:hypothetical protein